MHDAINKRFKELIEIGKSILRCTSSEAFVSDHDLPRAQGWLLSATNVLTKISSNKNNIYIDDFNRFKSSYNPYSGGISFDLVRRVQGILVAAHDDWSSGLLREFEFVVIADTFDQFLDHAALYHKNDRKIESAILASTVLEDTFKKIAVKHSIDTNNKTLDPLIDELVKRGVFTKVKAKRAKAYAGTRNHALHADWDKFDITDVGELIRGVRELVDNFL